MLSRRQLRVKVLLALYSFFQSEKSDLVSSEKELFRSIDKVYELYFLLLLFLIELAHDDLLDVEDVQRKFFPKDEEIHAKHRLHQMTIFSALDNSDEFKNKIKQFKLSWQTEQELVRKIFFELKKSKLYKGYMVADLPDEKEFLVQMIRQFLEESESLKSVLSERSIYWNEDVSFGFHLLIKTVRDFYDTKKLEFPSLYKDEKDDREFVKLLFEKTILHNKEFGEAIAAKTTNWEVDRIAMMDILLMKMALAEMTTFPSIPVKVSLNEYIDISKDYSTPKSKLFINGIIDKLAIEYKTNGKIVKTGRGLKE